PPHLRNEVDGALRRFGDIVARQARAFPKSFFLQGPADGRAIALTFDDGPDPMYTDQILQVLAKASVKATRCLAGSKLRRWPAIPRRIQGAGHATGGHGYEHVDLARRGPAEAVRGQLAPTAKAFVDILGRPMRIFRPPYGALTDDEIALFAQ